jgi:hypothetical protein
MNAVEYERRNVRGVSLTFPFARAIIGIKFRPHWNGKNGFALENCSEREALRGCGDVT